MANAAGGNDKQLVHDLIAALVGRGTDSQSNAVRATLESTLSNVTVGPGVHVVEPRVGGMKLPALRQEYEVGQNQVYATFESYAPLSRFCANYVLERSEPEGLRYVGQISHLKS